MSKEARDLFSLALLTVLVIGWLSFAGYSICQDRERKRAAKAFEKRLADRADLGQWEGEI
jgi:hypothetical protein